MCMHSGLSWGAQQVLSQLEICSDSGRERQDSSFGCKSPDVSAEASFLLSLVAYSNTWSEHPSEGQHSEDGHLSRAGIGEEKAPPDGLWPAEEATEAPASNFSCDCRKAQIGHTLIF